MAKKLTPPDAYGTLIEPATLKIERLLPGPIERIWSYLIDSELRRKWLAAARWRCRRARLSNWCGATTSSPIRPGSGRPGSVTSIVCSRITELDPPRKLAIAWHGSGDVCFELTPKGSKVLLDRHPSPPPRPRNYAYGRTRLAHAPRRSGGPDDGRGARAVLGRMVPFAEGIR